mgnify:CR=1 FL=1
MRQGKFKRLTDLLKRLDEDGVDPDSVLVNEDEVIAETSDDEEDE